MNLHFELRHDKVVLVPRTTKNGPMEVSCDGALAFIKINIGKMHDIRIKEGNYYINGFVASPSDQSLIKDGLTTST